MSRLALSLTFVVAAFAMSCEGDAAEPSRDGLSCLNAPAQYTCSTDGAKILECDDSSIWREHLDCDDHCDYDENDACCTAGGALTCPGRPAAE